jgi:hypothetical protein
MAVSKVAYGKWRTVVRRVSAMFAVFFGFISIFVAGPPKPWSQEGSGDNASRGFFSPNIAHADIPAIPESENSCENSCSDK